MGVCNGSERVTLSTGLNGPAHTLFCPFLILFVINESVGYEYNSTIIAILI